MTESLGNALSVTIVATGLESEIGLGDLKPDFTHKNYPLRPENEYHNVSRDDFFRSVQTPDQVPLEVDGMTRDGKLTDMVAEEVSGKRNKKEKPSKQPRRPNVLDKFVGSCLTIRMIN